MTSEYDEELEVEFEEYNLTLQLTKEAAHFISSSAPRDLRKMNACLFVEKAVNFNLAIYEKVKPGSYFGGIVSFSGAERLQEPVETFLDSLIDMLGSEVEEYDFLIDDALSYKLTLMTAFLGQTQEEFILFSVLRYQWLMDQMMLHADIHFAGTDCSEDLPVILDIDLTELVKTYYLDEDRRIARNDEAKTEENLN